MLVCLRLGYYQSLEEYIIKKIILTLVSVYFFFGCSKNIKADKIYVNGNIYTGTDEGKRQKYIAIKNEFIVDVGQGEYKHLLTKNTQIIDLHDHFVVPGFTDNHTHFMSGGATLMSIDLHSAKSPEIFRQRFQTYIKSINPGEWVTGGSWDHEHWGGELPNRFWIDQYTEQNPVLVSRVDGHMALANSKALELAGINKNTTNPSGGVIVKNQTTGEPTGILKDNAINHVSKIIPNVSKKKRKQILENALEYASSVGITQIHDMCSWEDLETYRKNKNTLTLRVYALPWYSNWKKLIALVKEEGYGDDLLRWNGMKAMVDGSLGSRTAWMYEPYLDDRRTSGLLRMTDTLGFKNIMKSLDDEGIQLAVHAIGDRANDWIIGEYINLIKINGNKDRRSRIEHAQHLTIEAINKIGNYNIIPSMQPYGCIDDSRWMHKRIGPSLMSRTYIFNTFLDKNVNLTFGSDWEVTPLNPLEGIYAAVTRQTLDGSNPNGWFNDQRISVEDAIMCYTKNNAFAGFQEDKLGTIEKGKYADFVVLSDDITKIEPINIPKTIVVRTVVSGRDVFTLNN